MIEEEIDFSTDEALMSSLAEHRLEDKLKLEPYSLARQTVAMALIGTSKTGLYNAIMTVWVCTLSENEVLKAHDDLEQSRLKAFKWGESCGYSLFNWKPVIDMYNRLDDELRASSQIRVNASPDGDAHPNVGGQPA
jgi:hypothetical protein